MREQHCEIKENDRISRTMMRMILDCDTADITAPGQFVNIRVPGQYLRRPISLCDYDGNSITLIYRIVGAGTAKMADMGVGESLDVLVPLGNGYDLPSIPDEPLLVGGGAGIPPLYGLARRITEKNPHVYLGYTDMDDIYYVDEFRDLGIAVDFQVGGYITSLVPHGGYVCTCGPMPMMETLSAVSGDGQFSLEARMACGFGVCMGCSIKVKDGVKRVCKDGPVFRKGEILW